ncbi:MAG: hypothetical protein KIT11_00145 [Fimbriimonadaceae bacterium]|nr:hypothetical protein [Fimbriimonadaceae bacterium]
MTFWTLHVINDGLAGGENVTVQIYANDGANTTGTNGTVLAKPGTLLWTSPAIPVQQGDRVLNIPIPNIAAPANITFTYKYQGGQLDPGPYDPNINPNLAGGRFLGKAVLGNSVGPTGVTWRRVFTTSGASDWGAQENPGGTFPTNIPFNIGASFWSGSVNVGAIGAPYDNQTNASPVAFFYGLPDDTGYTEAGNTCTVEGTARQISNIDMNIYAQTENESGNPTAKIRIWNVNGTSVFGGGAGTPTTLIWESPAQAIPKGLGNALTGEGELVTLSIPANFTLPANGEFCWSILVQGMVADGVAGPAARWRAETAPADAGGTPNGFFQTVTPGTGWEGPFIFQNNPPGSGTFVYQNPAIFDIKFTAGSTNQELFPSAFRVALGRQTAGNLASLQADDGNFLEVRKFIVPNQQVPPVNIEADFSTNITNPTSIKMDVKSRMGNTGSFQQATELRDFTGAAWVNTNTATITGTYTVKTATGTAPFNRYVSGGIARGRWTVRQTGPSALSLWIVQTDFAKMTIGG